MGGLVSRLFEDSLTRGAKNLFVIDDDRVANFFLEKIHIFFLFGGFFSTFKNQISPVFPQIQHCKFYHFMAIYNIRIQFLRPDKAMLSLKSYLIGFQAPNSLGHVSKIAF